MGQESLLAADRKSVRRYVSVEDLTSTHGHVSRSVRKESEFTTSRCNGRRSINRLACKFLVNKRITIRDSAYNSRHFLLGCIWVSNPSSFKNEHYFHSSNCSTHDAKPARDIVEYKEARDIENNALANICNLQLHEPRQQSFSIP